MPVSSAFRVDVHKRIGSGVGTPFREPTGGGQARARSASKETCDPTHIYHGEPSLCSPVMGWVSIDYHKKVVSMNSRAKLSPCSRLQERQTDPPCKLPRADCTQAIVQGINLSDDRTLFIYLEAQLIYILYRSHMYTADYGKQLQVK